MLPKASLIRKLCTLFLAAFFLSACGLVPGTQAAPVNESGTPVPTPTRDPSGYQAITAQSCKLADWAAMQSNKPQGDLIAWRPGSTDIAYLAPAERSSWYIGELALSTGPGFKQKVDLAPTILASGDLTWSPAGERLAFLAYRPNENLYTVMTVRPDGSELTDLFPNDLARTDGRTSQKAIIGWKSEHTLQVITSCGEECRQAYDIDIDSMAASQEGSLLTPTPVPNYHDLVGNLQMHRNTLETNPDFKLEQFPKGMNRPNWSPDERMIAYLDKRGILWLLTIQDKTNYLLDIGLRDVYETQWAANNHYLAIRAEDRIFLFQVPCEKPEK